MLERATATSERSSRPADSLKPMARAGFRKWDPCKEFDQNVVHHTADAAQQVQTS